MSFNGICFGRPKKLLHVDFNEKSFHQTIFISFPQLSSLIYEAVLLRELSISLEV